MNIKSISYFSLLYKLYETLLIILVSSSFIINARSRVPRLTVIIVVDQFAYNTLQKYSRYFNYGLHKLLTRGINYINAYQPHGLPATATGHAALSTGTYAKDHGIIGNSWLDEHNTIVQPCDDSVEHAAVLNPISIRDSSTFDSDTHDTGVQSSCTYDYGASSRFVMVDTLSDQFSLQSTPDKQHHVYALSMKDRAAIPLAGKSGKALWFDGKTGCFTSSKAYYDTLPIWVQQFNTHKGMNNKEFIMWHQAKPSSSDGYKFAHEQTFSYAQFKEGLVGKQIPIEWHNKPQDPFNLFLLTPEANHLLLDFACTCIETTITKKSNNTLLLWVSFSALDKAGHAFGPDSKETIDIIYHLDKQIERLMRCARRAVGKRETLCVLTADHGICPLVETIQEKGIPAGRYSSAELLTLVNDHLNKRYSSRTLVKECQNSQVYFNSTVINTLSSEQQKKVVHDTKHFLMQQPGIRRVWTYQELKEMVCEPHTIESYYKKQLYPGRSGQLIIQMLPYYDITPWEKGSDHNSPYDYNTHVPLIMYQHGALELKTIGQRVFTTQLANTLADILRIPKPSASTAERLPGIGREARNILF